MYLVGVGLHIRNEYSTLVGSPSVPESIMLPYELRYILLLLCRNITLTACFT
jgi:hypothetical protein